MHSFIIFSSRCFTAVKILCCFFDLLFYSLLNDLHMWIFLMHIKSNLYGFFTRFPVFLGSRQSRDFLTPPSCTQMVICLSLLGSRHYFYLCTFFIRCGQHFIHIWSRERATLLTTHIRIYYYCLLLDEKIIWHQYKNFHRFFFFMILKDYWGFIQILCNAKKIFSELLTKFAWVKKIVKSCVRITLRNFWSTL